MAAGGRRWEHLHDHPASAGSNQRAVHPGFPPGEVGLGGSGIPADAGGAQISSGPTEWAGGGSKPQVGDHTRRKKIAVICAPVIYYITFFIINTETIICENRILTRAVLNSLFNIQIFCWWMFSSADRHVQQHGLGWHCVTFGLFLCFPRLMEKKRREKLRQQVAAKRS